MAADINIKFIHMLTIGLKRVDEFLVEQPALAVYYRLKKCFWGSTFKAFSPKLPNKIH